MQGDRFATGDDLNIIDQEGTAGEISVSGWPSPQNHLASTGKIALAEFEGSHDVGGLQHTLEQKVGWQVAVACQQLGIASRKQHHGVPGVLGQLKSLDRHPQGDVPIKVEGICFRPVARELGLLAKPAQVIRADGFGLRDAKLGTEQRQGK